MALKSLQASGLLRHIVRSTVLTPSFENCSFMAASTNSTSNERLVKCVDLFISSHTKCKSYHTSSTLLKGHSKWSNIKHIKAAQDKIKMTIAQQLSRDIQQCLVRNPETDPKLNAELAALMKKAKANNIPNETVAKTIDRVVKLKDESNVTVFCGRGPGNVGICILCGSLKPHHTKSLLQGVIKKFGFSLHVSGDDLFEHKGKVEASLPEEDFAVAQADPENFNIDKFVDIAIESGAEDVTLEPSPEGPILQFMCGPQDLFKVQKAIGDTGLQILDGDRVYLPTTMVPVKAEYLEALEKLDHKLDIFPDVVKVIYNIELEEEAS